jgi:hypothetical protein
MRPDRGYDTAELCGACEDGHHHLCSGIVRSEECGCDCHPQGTRFERRMREMNALERQMAQELASGKTAARQRNILASEGAAFFLIAVLVVFITTLAVYAWDAEEALLR